MDQKLFRAIKLYVGEKKSDDAIDNQPNYANMGLVGGEVKAPVNPDEELNNVKT